MDMFDNCLIVLQRISGSKQINSLSVPLSGQWEVAEKKPFDAECFCVGRTWGNLKTQNP
jgi:hypothetical protein